MELCEGGKLPVAYTTEVYPVFFRHPQHGEYRGTAVDLWTSIAHSLCPEGAEFHQREDGYVVGADAACIDSLSLDKTQILDVRASAAAFFYEVAFVRSRENVYTRSSDLAFFIVLPPSIIATMVGLAVLHTTVNYARSKCVSAGIIKEPTKELFDTLYFIRRLINQLSVMWLFQFYLSCFQGNSISVRTQAPMVFAEMVHGFKAGLLKPVLAEEEQYFSTDEELDIFGGQPFLRTSSVTESFKAVCDNKQAVGFFTHHSLRLYERSPLSANCFLQKVHHPNGAPTGSNWLTQSLDVGDPYFYVVNRSQPLLLTETINFAVLSFFSQTMMENTLFNRYVHTKEWIAAARTEAARNPPPVHFPYSPISITHCQWPIIFFVTGCLTAFLALGAELLYRKLLCKSVCVRIAIVSRV